MTKLGPNDKVTRSVEMRGRVFAVTLDGETKEIVYREKGCRTAYGLNMMAILDYAIRCGREIKKESNKEL